MNSYERTKLGPQAKRRRGVYLSCVTCATEFYVYPSRVTQAKRNGNDIKYCSSRCYDKNGEKNPMFGHKHKKETLEKLKTHPNRPVFKADHTNPNVTRYGTGYVSKTLTSVKKTLIEKNARCVRCGYDDEPRILQAHHKDRNKKNNGAENIEILCPTCHVLNHFMAGDGLFNSAKTASKAFQRSFP